LNSPGIRPASGGAAVRRIVLGTWAAWVKMRFNLMSSRASQVQSTAGDRTHHGQPPPDQDQFSYVS
jgi:hypothetical protein